MTSVTEKNFFLKTADGRKLTILLLVAFAAMLGLDQVSKHHVQKTLLLYEDPTDVDLHRGGRVPVFSLGERSVGKPDPSNLFFNMQFHYSRNKGAAFSMLSDVEDHYRVPFFYGVTLIAVILITIYLRGTPIDQYFTRFGLVMILAGALGNFIDRIQYGYVVDFIDVEWEVLGWHHDFAIFNIADVAINIGVIMLLLEIVRSSMQKAHHAPDKAVA